jgi:predicted signal transduction protein with EAL and GGDEF domain
MIRKRIAQLRRQAARPLIPPSVRLRAMLAVITIMVPFVLLLAVNSYGEYGAARVLQGDGHPGMAYAAYDRIAVAVILAILWVATVLMVIARGVEDRVIRPLRHLTRVASRLAEGELDSRVDLSRVPMIDMRRLAATINDMAGILEKLALTDSLTAVANRRQFDAVIAAEVKRSTRMKKGLALLLIDVDKFKDYNDLYGHGAGDLCLKRIAAAPWP